MSYRPQKVGKDQSRQEVCHPLMALMGLSATSRIMLVVVIILGYLSPTLAEFRVQPCAEFQCFAECIEPQLTWFAFCATGSFLSLSLIEQIEPPCVNGNT